MKLPQHFDRVLSASELTTGFYQHGSGNCASIAAIKASLIAFGAKPVFADMYIQDNHYHVIMRDAPTIFSFSQSELGKAADYARFLGEDQQLLDHAHFMFAAMAKRAQYENNDGRAGESFEHALTSLNDGEYWKDGPGWLGLTSIVHHGPNSKIPFLSYIKCRNYLRKQIAGIAKSPKHTWFSSYMENDRYGKVGRPFHTLSGVISLDVDLATKM